MGVSRKNVGTHELSAGSLGVGSALARWAAPAGVVGRGVGPWPASPWGSVSGMMLRRLRVAVAAWFVLSLALGQVMFFSPSVTEVAAATGRPPLPPGIVRLPFAGTYQVTNVPGCYEHNRNHPLNTSRWGKEVNDRAFDFGMNGGTRVLAAGDGRVLSNYVDPYGAKILIIDHGNGVRSYYAHLSAFDVAPGKEVKAGQLVGKSGNSGYGAAYHLHFSVTTNGDPASTGNAANINSLPGIPWDINQLDANGYVTNCYASPNEKATGPAENTAPANPEQPPANTCTTGYQLSVNKPVAVLPDPVSVGQEVWAETEIVNTGCDDYKGNIYLGTSRSVRSRSSASTRSPWAALTRTESGR